MKHLLSQILHGVSQGFEFNASDPIRTIISRYREVVRYIAVYSMTTSFTRLTQGRCHRVSLSSSLCRLHVLRTLELFRLKSTGSAETLTQNLSSACDFGRPSSRDATAPGSMLRRSGTRSLGAWNVASTSRVGCLFEMVVKDGCRILIGHLIHDVLIRLGRIIRDLLSENSERCFAAKVGVTLRSKDYRNY